MRVRWWLVAAVTAGGVAAVALVHRFRNGTVEGARCTACRKTGVRVRARGVIRVPAADGTLHSCRHCGGLTFHQPVASGFTVRPLDLGEVTGRWPFLVTLVEPVSDADAHTGAP